jgi:hypothetical protein
MGLQLGHCLLVLSGEILALRVARETGLSLPS